MIARLLFGSGIDDLSPLQAARLAGAVATLAGRGPGFLNQARAGIGLDNLDVTTDKDGNVGVAAGAYLSEDIYTNVEFDGDGDTKVTINLDLTDAFTVQGSVESDGNSGIGVVFERDY